LTKKKDEDKNKGLLFLDMDYRDNIIKKDKTTKPTNSTIMLEKRMNDSILKYNG
jgi:hypothetical protein